MENTGVSWTNQDVSPLFIPQCIRTVAFAIIYVSSAAAFDGSDGIFQSLFFSLQRIFFLHSEDFPKISEDYPKVCFCFSFKVINRH